MPLQKKAWTRVMLVLALILVLWPELAPLPVTLPFSMLLMLLLSLLLLLLLLVQVVVRPLTLAHAWNSLAARRPNLVLSSMPVLGL